MMRNVAVTWLLAVGLLGMTADLFQCPALKAVAAVTLASPAPKVFSAVEGLETYSTRFFVEWTDLKGTPRSVLLTPDNAAGLRGPYNRRNIFGAVLAYGPVLVRNEATRPMFDAVAKYALCGDAPLLRELGIDPVDVEPGSVHIRLEPLPGTDIRNLTRVLEAPCR
jgi:hypothetical protein